jgi:hypothetical protein
MTLTHAGICFLVAVILFGIAFVLDWTPNAFPSARVYILAWFFVALGLLLGS